jgi:hypothetical protein
MDVYQKLDEEASRLFIQAGRWDVRTFKSDDGGERTGV